MMALSQAVAVLQGRMSGADVRFEGVSSDSRGLRPGELFVALRGTRFDGHQFLDAAARAGAAAALVDRHYGGRYPLPVGVVDDTRLALGVLARYWRSRFSLALVAVAGSNGKTTVKEMLASILRRHAGDDAVIATVGNLNNDIGLPLTLLRLRSRHGWGVVELGMNHKGEIAYLAGIARPTVALVNNAQREHLEFMHSIEEIAEENASVYAALPEDGIAVVNADDGHAGLFRRRAAGRRMIEFSLHHAASLTATYVLEPLISRIRVRMPTGEAAAALAIPGMHNVRNALAAAACAYGLGIAPATIAEGLEAFRPYTGRLQVKRARGGGALIDDTYNANPDSVRAAIDVLAACPPPTVLILGDMGEVGQSGREFHREVGAYARDQGIGSLLAMGQATRDAVDAFGAGGRHFERLEDLLASVRGQSILVKGSRFMRMERVVAALADESEGGR